MVTFDESVRSRASVTTPVPAAVSRTRCGRRAFARLATTSAYGVKRHEVAIIEFCQRSREGGNLVVPHELLLRSRSTHPIGLSVRCGLPRTWNWRSPRAAGLQYPSHAAPPRRNRNRSRPRCSRHSHPRSSRMAWCKRPQGSKQYLALAAAAALARTQSPRKHLAVHASKLVIEPRLKYFE